MEKKRYSLESKESNRFVRYAQIAFGIVCLIVAAWWTAFLIQTEGADNFWVATLFILFFGIFQIYSGMGMAAKYIDISGDSLSIKQTAICAPELIASSDIKTIEILPLSVQFFLKSGKKRVLRFGITYSDLIDTIKDAIIEFAEEKKIPYEEKSEKI
jgi:hypothetical protein